MLPRYESYWLYGAVEPTTGDSLFLELPALDPECFQGFLNEFARSYPKSLNLLLLDGAPAHTAARIEVPDNVLLVRLPPYSPELNPIERLWQDLRKCLGDDLPRSLDALKANVARQICAYTPQSLASICGYPYLLRALA